MSLLSSANGIRGGHRTLVIGAGRMSDDLLRDAESKPRKVGKIYNKQWLVDIHLPRGVKTNIKVTNVKPIRITRNHSDIEVYRGTYQGRSVERDGYVNGVRDAQGRTVGKWHYTKA